MRTRPLPVQSEVLLRMRVGNPKLFKIVFVHLTLVLLSVIDAIWAQKYTLIDCIMLRNDLRYATEKGGNPRRPHSTLVYYALLFVRFFLHIFYFLHLLSPKVNCSLCTTCYAPKKCSPVCVCVRAGHWELGCTALLPGAATLLCGPCVGGALRARRPLWACVLCTSCWSAGPRCMLMLFVGTTRSKCCYVV